MTIETKASFDKMTISAGKVVPQMTLDENAWDCVPRLSQMTGQTVCLGVADTQRQLFSVVEGKVETGAAE